MSRIRVGFEGLLPTLIGAALVYVFRHQLGYALAIGILACITGLLAIALWETQRKVKPGLGTPQPTIIVTVPADSRSPLDFSPPEDAERPTEKLNAISDLLLEGSQKLKPFERRPWHYGNRHAFAQWVHDAPGRVREILTPTDAAYLAAFDYVPPGSPPVANAYAALWRTGSSYIEWLRRRAEQLRQRRDSLGK
jgi:hypothetical protein